MKNPNLWLVLALLFSGCANGGGQETPPPPTPTPSDCTPPPPTPTTVPQTCNTTNEQCGPTTCEVEGSPRMLPGSNCQSCHSPGNLPDDVKARARAARLVPAEDNLYWTIAGTAFSDIYGSGPLAGAIVQVTDAKGKIVSLTTNAVGNFYSSTAVTPPLTASLTADGITYQMASPVATGACSSCHRCDGPPGGKLYGGPQPTPEPTPTPCPTPETTFSSINSSILQPSCATSGCHGHGSASGGLDLDSSKAYANLVDVSSQELPSMLRVRPGDTSKSYLWHKLVGDQASVGGSGSRMPPLGLTATQMQRIEQWIAAGAPNN